MSQNLAKRLKKPVAFNQAVTYVTQNEDHVVVNTESGSTFKAKYVVFACAPLLTSKIVFNPPMPTSREEIACRMPLGKVIKV